MEHALALARKGVGLASPNPHVGCVIVRSGEIVGEGFHQYDWREHAEIVALKAAGKNARGATLYVNLEPCNHTGRTGPCSEAILAAGVARVVAAMRDPNAKTAGGGFERLHAGGVEILSGVCEDAAQRLNEAFSWWIRTKKPFVTLKSAMTLDGQLALTKTRKKTGQRRESDWITSQESRAEVQRMRHASDALITGIGTILTDDPVLTDRSGLPRRRKLLRVVLDSKLRLPVKSRILQTADDDLLVFTAASLRSAKAKELRRRGVEIADAGSQQGRVNLTEVMKELGAREILGALLEAGPRLNGAALTAGAVQKLALFVAPKIAGRDGAPFASGIATAGIGLDRLWSRTIGPDISIEGYLRRKIQ